MKKAIRQLVKRRFPSLVHVHNVYAGMRFRGKTAQQVFESIYQKNAWWNEETSSGEGSEIAQTQQVSRLLPGLLQKYSVKTLLDLPCGDFNWMSRLDLPIDRYIGADIVHDLVRRNQERFASDKVSFRRIDLTRDPLPDADLILCRDCLVHLSYDMLKLVFENLQRSGIMYLLTTTYPETRSNRDIVTGGWRKLDLRRPPFNLPEPLDVIDEQCTEGSFFADKTLGLWRVEDVARVTI